MEPEGADDAKPSQDSWDESPAAYLHLIDSRSVNQSQRLLPIWDRVILKVGRDPRANAVILEDDTENTVSRNHCEFYVVVYEPTVNHVYVRDRKSVNGTFVNGKLIGSGPTMSPGYLLQHGDVIEVRPYWKFVFHQSNSPPCHDLTGLQAEEAKLFSDKYELTNRCLGSGAEAVVYLAVDVSSSKQLVCKLVNLDKRKSKNPNETAQSKLQEADILRQLRHPNILPYIDAFISPHSLYTFTELASGGDLMSFIYRHEIVKEFDAKILIRQVVRGLRYLHTKGILHRDLKPENILLAYSPKLAYHRVMLSDFGSSAVPQRNRMISNVGTSAYQAPEVQSIYQTQTGAVDIWSLGVVVLLLLASSCEVHCEGLNRLDQREIFHFLKRTFSKLDQQPSSNAKSFIWYCLQTQGSNRMTALDCTRHDWLSTPRKHQLFFQKLDYRMMVDWESETQIRPMPLELPDLKGDSPQFQQTDSGARVSQELPLLESLLASGEDVKVPVSHLKRRSSTARSDQKEKESVSPTAPGRESKVPAHEPTSKDDKHNLTMTVPATPWKGFTKPKVEVTPERPSKRRQSSRARFRDTSNLPLTNLKKHLNLTKENRQREEVLEELKKTNAKFLVDEAPMTPATPARIACSPQVPLRPKKPKTSRPTAKRPRVAET